MGLMRGHYFAVWDSSTDGSCLRLRIAAKFTHSVEAALPGWSAGCALFLRDIPWHSFYIWGKKERLKTSVRVVEECQLGTIQYVDMDTFSGVATTGLSIPVYRGMLQDTGFNTWSA